MSLPKTLNYLSTRDLAALTGKSAEFWARLCKSKALPTAIKLGNEWRVEQAAFEEFMRGGQSATARPGRLTARQARRSA